MCSHVKRSHQNENTNYSLVHKIQNMTIEWTNEIINESLYKELIKQSIKYCNIEYYAYYW